MTMSSARTGKSARRMADRFGWLPGQAAGLQDIEGRCLHGVERGLLGAIWDARLCPGIVEQVCGLLQGGGFPRALFATEIQYDAAARSRLDSISEMSHQLLTF